MDKLIAFDFSDYEVVPADKRDDGILTFEVGTEVCTNDHFLQEPLSVNRCPGEW